MSSGTTYRMMAVAATRTQLLLGPQPPHYVQVRMGLRATEGPKRLRKPVGHWMAFAWSGSLLKFAGAAVDTHH
jgi:hypothetical protein